MRSRKNISRSILSLFAATAFVVLFLFSGCATKKNVSSIEAPLIWPSPPAEPRIAYVQSIGRPADVGIKPSMIVGFAHWITGSQKGNEPLVKPFGVAFDENENLCLTDTGANIVCYFDRKKMKWKRWEKLGKLYFQVPVAIAKRNGVFFVADSGLASVLAFDEKAKLLFRISEKLERPSGLVIVGDKLFVTDSQRHCIVIFDLNGRYLSEFGKRGMEDGDFNFPTHLSADSEGNLFVTDSMNGRIQVFSSDGKFKNQIGSTGNSTGHFSKPKGTAVDTFGHVYVVDALFDNVQIFDRAGAFLLNLGDGGTDKGQFWLPNGVAINRANEIFITDSYNHRVQVLKYIGQP